MKLVSRQKFIHSVVTLGGAALLTSACSDDDDDYRVGDNGGNGTGTNGDGTNGNGTSTDANGLDGEDAGGEQPVPDAGDASGMDAGPTVTECTSDVGFAEQHVHDVMVPAEDVRAGETMTYLLSRVLGHRHELEISADMMERLAAGETLEIASSTDSGHSHDVTVSCSA